MKKPIVAILALILTGLPALFPQQDDETVKEKVNVVNIEIPVRVYHKDKPVDDLSKGDFVILEDKKPQTINGFFTKRTKIGIKSTEAVDDPRAVKPRFFVLIFRLTNLTQEIQDGLDHLFDKMLREGDQLLVFANSKSLSFNTLEDKNGVKENIKQVLARESKDERNALYQFIQQIEQELNMEKFKIDVRRITATATGRAGFQSDHYFIREFLTKYLLIWNQYKVRYLIPDKEKYYNFARYLKNIRKEKWVINFFQLELFPDIVLSSDAKRILRELINDWRLSTNQERVTFARIVNKLLMDIDRAVRVSHDFPSQEISNLFYKSDAIYHTVFIRTDMPSLVQNREYLQTANDVESCLAQITKDTGGLLVASKDIVPALDTIGEKEDVYYLLTYAPENPDQVGNIKVKVKRKRCKVIYDETTGSGITRHSPEMEAVEGPPVKIQALSFKNKHLNIALSNFYMKKGTGGKLEIRIRIKNKQDIAIFDQTKKLNAQLKEIKISLNFSGIGKGRYDIVVDVKDLYTRKTDSDLIQVRL